MDMFKYLDKDQKTIRMGSKWKNNAILNKNIGDIAMLLK